MLRTLIVDDEPLARERLGDLLGGQPDVQIVGAADGGADAVQKLEALRPDLAFLDVQMPDLDGFGVLRMLEMDPLPLVIFVTAYDQYAVEAFEVSAVDYLLKPVRRERLDQALVKAREKVAARNTAGGQLHDLLRSVARRPAAYLQRLPVRMNRRILILPLDQVAALRIDRGQVCVTTAEGEYWTKYTTFTELENLLDPQVFMRIHRQAMINLNHVREVTAYDKHSARLALTTGQEVTVSRSYLKTLRRALNL
jgi:two-component system, LytTR family, response regulator